MISDGQPGSQGSDSKEHPIEVALNDAFFSGVNWNKTVEYLKQADDRNLLGLSVLESDILWRYFVSQMQQ